MMTTLVLQAFFYTFFLHTRAMYGVHILCTVRYHRHFLRLPFKVSWGKGGGLKWAAWGKGVKRRC